MATIFVNPRWNTNDNPITVYVSGDLVYNDSGHGGTEANCYSTFEKAYDFASSAATIYVYNAPNSPLSLAAPSGEYSQQLSSAFFIEKNLYVRAGIFQVGSVEHYTYSFNIIRDYTVDFGVTESFNIAQNTIFNVWNGANFQLGSTGSSTSVSFENSGTVCVSNGATFQAGTTSITNNVEIEVTGSAFSVASVTNNGTFKVKGTSKLEIGNLSGTITLAVIPANDNNPAVNPTLNASSITGGGTNGGTLTVQGDLTFTGANTLNGVTLNATGKTVTVGTGNSDSLTVKGTSTLNIGTLSGTIKTDADALTTLNASSITGGSISAQNNLKFTGANTLNGVVLNATGKTVTVGNNDEVPDSLTVGGTSTLNIGNLNGTITVSVSAKLTASSITGGTIAATAFGADFFGVCILDGVTLNAGDQSIRIDDEDSLTFKGTSTLKTLGLQGTRTIKLDGAEIVDSRIGGYSGDGGTLVVESDKTATFSTTGSNSNDFGRTSINNSGTINVNGLLSLSTTTGTISNSGTINVNGRLTTGTIDNSGTIALNGGATVSSTISGGSITTSNTGTVTVHDSTISSSAFTATADEVIFYYRNTLNGVTLDATGKTVTVNGTLTVKGTSTLNATNITGGTISAQDNLTFTGTNTLNGVTLDATGNTVTIGNGDGIADSLTVKGTNTLNIGTLVGTIKTDADALTTLNASNITGGSISAQNNLTFTGANTLNDVTLDAMVANKTVTIGTGEGDSLTVGGTSTLNIGTLDGTIKTAAGATLTGSDITGGGTNGGTITALGTLTFANYTDLRNITLDAHDQTVDTGYSLWLGGAITLIIDTLISTILLNENTTFTNSTISNGNDSSRLYIYGGKVVTFAGANTIFDAKVDATGRITNDGSITVESNGDKGELTVYRIENSGSITVGSAGSANEAADACSLTGTLLNNGGTITVIGGENQSNRSLLNAAYITNGDNNNHTGMMSLTNSVLNATRLENYGRGNFDPGPPRTFQAAITISDSTVSIKESLTNGATNNTSATIEFNNSTVTADSVTNYGTHNGTDGNTGKVGFAVTDCTFTVNNTFTNYGWIYVNNSTLQATSLVNNGNRFYVYGTSTLNIGTLTGRIDIINGDNTDSLLTLNNSHITGKVNDDGSLGSSIYVSNPLTFTGTNTLTNTKLFAENAGKPVTIGNSDSLTVGGTSTLSIASLNGTIKTDADALTTLNASSITNGTISVQNSLAFTGANPLNGNTLNGITLDATGKTVTVNGTLTVGGTSTLNIGTLDGTIKTGSAGTTLNASSITGGGTNGGTITVQGDLTFTGANTLNSVTLSAAGQAVTVDSGATLTVGGTSTLNIGTLDGTITVASGATLSNSTVGGTVKVQSGETLTLDGVNAITTLDLSATDAAVTMDWQDKLSFTGFEGSYAKKLTINVNDYFFWDFSTPVLDSVNGDWTKAMYQELLTNTTWSTDQYEFVVKNGDLYINMKEIDVKNGMYTEIAELRGVKAVIQEGSGTTEFTKAVYGGTKVDASDSVTRNTDISIETGTFDRFFVGGNNISMETKDTSYTVSAPEGKKQSVKISDGVFDAIVATADRIQKGAFTLNSDLEMTISGGQFKYCVAGGVLNSLYDGSSETVNGTADVNGNITLTIAGGVFDNACWIYGGNLATNKASGSKASTLYGDVLVTIDCGAGNAIQLSRLVVGSSGWGEIRKVSETKGGNTKLVFTGNGSNLSFTDDGDLWGGCSGDYVSPVTGLCADSLVEGDRLLSFEGFIGDLNCKKIRDFSSIRLIGNSAVGLTRETVDMSGFENWTFEKGSSLSGTEFLNNFTGDTFAFTGSEEGFSGADVLKNVGASALTGFAYEEDEDVLVSGFSSVTLFGHEAVWNGSNAYVTAIENSTVNYKLTMNSSGMSVGIA